MKRFYLPIVLLWRDKTIDVCGASEVWFSWIYIGRGRTLTLINCNLDSSIIRVTKNLTNYGTFKIRRVGDEQ